MILAVITHTSSNKNVIEFKVKILDAQNVFVTLPSDMGKPDKHTRINMDFLASETSDLFKSWLKEPRFRSTNEVAVFGSYLYRIIFDTEIDPLFSQVCQRINQNVNLILRVILEFSKDAKELASLPWEYIYFPNTAQKKGFFIASKSQLILSRNVSVEMPIKKESSDMLRVLIVICEPEDLGHIQWQGVFESIQRLKDRFNGRVDIKQLSNPNIGTFRQTIKDFTPNILHFIGHGRWTVQNERGEIAFGELKLGKYLSRWIEDREFANSFDDFQPHVIFLHACEGAASDTIEHFKGVALQLIYTKVPAVVAMQYPIENVAASNFSVKFYECLAKGDPIDLAVQKGRAQLMNMQLSESLNCRTFGSPVVYSIFNELPITKRQRQPIQMADKTQIAEIRTLVCPSCNTPSGAIHKFCTNCSLPLIICSKCGVMTSPTFKYCQNCKSAYIPSNQLADVVKVDIVDEKSREK